MVKIAPFEVEQWMDTYETTPGVLNIAETCAASLSIADLASLAEPVLAHDGRSFLTPADPLSALATTKLTYGAIRGSLTLRQQVVDLLSYDSGSSINSRNNAITLGPESVIIAQGAIAANYLLFYTLVGPGDHVVCTYPTYQQLYDVPRSLGAQVSLWPLRADHGHVPDVAELEVLVQPNTKMIVLNNPNNPLGVPIPRAVLQSIVDFARARDIIVFCDEVYLPLYHGGPVDLEHDMRTDAEAREELDAARPPSIVNFGYAKTISTGSMSKAFSLAGLRVGWAVSRDPAIVAAMLAARDYTTISVSQLDDGMARYALSDAVRRPLLRHNTALARKNVQILKWFVERWASRGRVRLSWVQPTAGTTALVTIRTTTTTSAGEEVATKAIERGDVAEEVDMAAGAEVAETSETAKADTDAEATPAEPVDDVAFCIDVLDKCKVMMVPACKCFGHGQDFKGSVRIGYANETPVIMEALAKLDWYLQEYLA